MNVVLTANSPGEVAAWLTPVVGALRERAPDVRIWAFLPPCAFASGAEERVVAAIPGVTAAYGPRAYLRYLLLRQRPAGFAPRGPGVVGYLGGDLVHAVLLARRLGYPILAYTEGFARWAGRIRAFLVPDEAARERVRGRGVADRQVEVIGDLMVDAVQTARDRSESRRLLGLEADRPVLALFPGSRPFEVRHGLPFFLRVAELAGAELPGLQCLVGVSPFVDGARLSEALAAPQGPFEAARAEVEPIAASSGDTGAGAPGPGEPAAFAPRAWRILTERGMGALAIQGCQYDVMQAADVALTIPGSNTAEMAALGVPMVVAVPLNAVDEIPLRGVAGVLTELPLVGRGLKRWAVRRLAGRVRFTALPNLKARREVVPEVRGVLTPEDLVLALVPLLRDDKVRRRMAGELRGLMGDPGAAARFAQRLLAAAGTQAGTGPGGDAA